MKKSNKHSITMQHKTNMMDTNSLLRELIQLRVENKLLKQQLIELQPDSPFCGGIQLELYL